MKIRLKLLSGFMGIALVVSIFGYLGLTLSDKGLSDRFAPFTSASTAIASYVKRAEGHLFLYLMLGDRMDREKFFKRLDSLNSEISKIEKFLLQPEQKNTVDQHYCPVKLSNKFNWLDISQSSVVRMSPVSN